MTKEEAIEKLNDIQRRAYIGLKTAADSLEWHRIQREVLRPLGYGIGRKRINGECVWHLKLLADKASARNNRFECEWVNKDTSPNHKHLVGNCTTRAMTYALNGAMTYDEIEREQYRLGSVYGTARNALGTWEKVLTNRGWSKVRLYVGVRADRFAVKTSQLDCPIVIISSQHAAITDRGCVVDSWDSRGKRVKEVLVKDEYVQQIRNLFLTVH